MKVYHGSNLAVQSPDIKHSKKYLDFGQGFYVTVYEEQAQKWAKRKAMRYGGTPTVTVFEIPEQITGYIIKDFKNDDESWLDFVCDCRDGQQRYKEYDVIIGNVADDDVFKSVDMYRRGIWDKERTIKEIRYYKRNNQIAFIKQDAIDKCVTFIRAYEVGEKNDKSK